MSVAMPQSPDQDRKPRSRRQALGLAALAVGVYAVYVLWSFLS